MDQQNHDMTDKETVTLDTDTAREVYDFIDSLNLDDDASNDLLVTLDNVANGEDGAALTAEQAAFAAELVRDNGNGDNDDLLTALDSVAGQHPLAAPLEQSSEHDGSVNDVDRDKSSPLPEVETDTNGNDVDDAEEPEQL